eukprot:3770841-Heterocapsa_arctica.AAC.1
MDRTPGELAHRAVDTGNMAQWRGGPMEAGRGRRYQPMGQEGCPGDQGRVAAFRQLRQGAQGQLSRGM